MPVFNEQVRMSNNFSDNHINVVMSLYRIIDRSEQATVRTAYRLKNLGEKLSRFQNHLTFLIQYRNKRVIPKGLRVKVPIRSRKGQDIERRTNLSVLSESIKHSRRTKMATLREFEITQASLRSNCSSQQFQQIVSWAKNSAEKISQLYKRRQIRKLQLLVSEKHNVISTVYKKPRQDLVVNRSSRQLSTPEREVLSLGLNFALPEKRLPMNEIIASTELTASSLDQEKAQQLREDVKQALQHHISKKKKSRVSPRHFTAIKQLKHDDSIVILPADKGNATVVLDKKEYTEKMHDLLQDDSYKLLKKDPTSKLERKIDTTLKQLEKNGEIPQQLRKKITQNHSYIPQLYGLPKIHKPNTPFRPIVSSIGSSTQLLAKELARILNPLRGNTSSYIKNSSHFVQTLDSISMCVSDLMVSFDVKSLFTRVPIPEALQIIEARLIR